MRHFLRIDGGVAIGPSLGAVTFVKTGDTLHLDDEDPVEGKVAYDIAAASSGWLEVNEAGMAVPRRSATATPVVIPPVDPPSDPHVFDPLAPDSGGAEPPPQD
jgi:hypothetical protein